jgi:SAM-dependent methyltransferase
MNYLEEADFAEKRKFLGDLQQMLEMNDIAYGEWNAIELGGEGGILAGLIAGQVQHVISTDIVAVQEKQGGAFASRLAEKFQRNGETFPLEKVEFLRADAQRLPFRDDWFDFCFSQNAFEHIPDPEKSLREAVRVTRPGGYIYLMFDPLWTADSGSHFLHRIGEPWLHLIADDKAIEARMRANGADDAEVDSFLHHMNRKPINYYRQTFPSVIDELGARVVIYHEWSGCVDSSYVNHPNLDSASKKLGLADEDLLVRGLRYLIQV